MKLLHKGVLDWRGEKHKLELFASSEIESIGPIKQVQSVPFINENRVVLLKHVDGYFGLPGGSIEKDERYDAALRRETKEEIGCDIVSFGLIGFIKDTGVFPPMPPKYQLRYWTLVQAIEGPVHDPCRKAIGRKIVRFDKANEILGWGERGRVLLNLAREEYIKNSKRRSA